MDQITIEAWIFMLLGWTFVFGLLIGTMSKVLTGKVEYDVEDEDEG